MKAWILENVGKLVYREDVKEPVLNKKEVLVKVKAAGICGSDIQRVYKQGAHTMPLIIGHEFSGQVVKCQENVSETWLGKRVAVFPLIPCGNCIACRLKKYEMCSNYSYLGSRINGGFAEYVAVPEWNLYKLPWGITYEQAAMIEPMAVAVHAIRRMKFKSNSTIAVYGFGTIGQLIVMFLLERGIKDIYVLGCKDFQKQTAINLGVSENNYCNGVKEDVTSFIRERTKGKGIDVAFECVGKNETFINLINMANVEGQICLIGNPYRDMTIQKEVYSYILRKQLIIKGTWNSSYLGCNTYDMSSKANLINNDYNQSDDWFYVIKKLAEGKINPERLITHRFYMADLEKGFCIMKDKTEDYTKIIMMN